MLFNHLPEISPGALIFAATLLAMAIVAAQIAFAHDWYPPGCCHELVMEDGRVVKGDCGPADLIGSTAAGLILRQRGTGLTVTIPPDFPKNKIKKNEHDSQWHICVSRGDGYETEPGYIYCIFEPSAS